MPDYQEPPPTVLAAVERTAGEPHRLEPLGGLSGSAVRRVHAAGGTVIVKGGVRAAEIGFYRIIAPLLAVHGVIAPQLHWAGWAGGRRWLILEDVPNPLPRRRWGADEAVVAVLARLHAACPLPRLRARDAYRPAWTAQATASALRAFPPDGRARLEPVLETLRRASDHLFAPRCPLSGDANPLNWGLRADDTLALFDWERFCRGTPALDLAALIPGLGSREEFAHLARCYQGAEGTCGGHPGDLDLDIGLAKAWTVVEFLAGVAAGTVPDGPTAAWLRDAVPGWASSLVPAR